MVLRLLVALIVIRFIRWNRPLMGIVLWGLTIVESAGTTRSSLSEMSDLRPPREREVDLGDLATLGDVGALPAVGDFSLSSLASSVSSFASLTGLSYGISWNKFLNQWGGRLRSLGRCRFRLVSIVGRSRPLPDCFWFD